ncbi:CPBP family intramembrane glutamic endopeptidase [Maribacter arenosus]|uniref:CPBP family intramembrane metalloprotease n=1 Tax=Maribacter arenosus TaxID=1854708 RepID=A0ABR7VD07_9FLAO|nr:type II CAAX endopeptidase family protein [Maribacter arenosus]MBD0849944.1 CPBP family intramembrane metalloprotease [Maribacter arenosus]
MKILNSKGKREIILFSVVVIALSSVICFSSYKLDDPNVSILTVFVPSTIALIITAITKGKKGLYELFVKQTVKKTGLKWLLISLIGIPVLASLAVLTSLDFDISRFDLRTTQLLPQIIIIVLIAIGEEYGWRGFLLPRLLDTFNLLYSSIILGLIWGFWHFPAYLIGTGIPLQMNFIVFLLWVILGTLFISWIYYYTKSVLTSILAHISANAAFNYLLILPEFTGSMNTFWLFILYLSVLMMMIFYIKRKDLLKGDNNKYY